MKSERRHELEQNQLADWLAKKIEAVKPYQNAILGVLLLVLVAVVWYSWSSRQAAVRTTESWDQFFAAMNVAMNLQNPAPEALEDLAEEYAGESVGFWAATVAGDVRMAIGCSALFKNKPTANENLRQAAEHYRSVLDGSQSPTLLERANYGLARTLEAQGSLGKAVEHYQAVVSRWPDGAYAVAASRRLDDLEKASTKEFYDDFAKFDPTPRYSAEPGQPGERLPFDLESLPEGPVFSPALTTPLEQRGVENEKPLPEETPGDSMDTSPAEPATTTPEGTAPDVPAAAAPTPDATPSTPDASPSAPDATPSGTSAPDSAVPDSVPQPPAAETPAMETPATETPATEAPAAEASPEKGE
ncbi:MAG: hypothetical protein JXB62_05385 [Pirellulales bacterium]|nr:hypothetical protein [Pirellulales bacterium]